MDPGSRRLAETLTRSTMFRRPEWRGQQAIGDGIADAGSHHGGKIPR